MTQEKKIISSLKEMREFAEKVAEQLSGGELLLLVGELGSGKTTFATFLGESVGVRGRITSPTFTIVSEYLIEGHETLKKYVHVDLYRLSIEEVKTEESVREVLNESRDNTNLTIIEWADRLSVDAPPDSWQLAFDHGDNVNERVVTFHFA